MSRTSASPAFVGRWTEFEWLQARLSDALDGVPQILLLCGDAGVGKTRLLREFQTSARGQGIHICYGRAYENLALPYVPFEQVFRLIREAPDGLRGEEREIIGAFLAGSDRRDSGTHEKEQRDAQARLFLVLTRAVREIAADQPLLIVFDDLHWADRTSLDLFSHLAFSLSDAADREEVRILLLASFRPVDPAADLGHAIARLRREPICKTLELGGLDESGVGRLLSGLGLERASHQLVDTVFRATGGNPLFVQHVVDHLTNHQAIEDRGGYLVTSSVVEHIELPRDVTSAVAASVDALPETCQQMLVLASHLGDTFLLDELMPLAGQEEEALIATLEPAVGRSLIRSAGRRYEFEHPLVRHVCYGRVSAARRQRLHFRIAEELVRAAGATPSERALEVAHHLLAAGSLADTGTLERWATAAGERSLELFAWGDAARFYRAAAAVLQGKEDEASVRRRAELHFRAARSLTRAFDSGPSLDEFDCAIADFSRVGDPEGLARALMEKARNQITLNSVPYGTLLDVVPLEHALEQLGANEDALRASLLEVLANIYWTGRDPNRAAEHATRSLEIAERLGDSVLCARATGALALAQMQCLQVREWLETCERSAAYAHRGGDLWFHGQRLVRVPMALCALGRLRDAAPIAHEGSALTRKTHNWGEYSLALANLVVIDVARGEFAAAEEHARELMSMIERAGYPWSGPIALPALACARYLVGAQSAAEDAIEILLEPGRVFRDTGGAFDSVAQLYRRLIRGDPDGAEASREPSLAEAASGARRIADIGSLFRYCAEVELAALTGNAGLAERACKTLGQVVARGVVLTSGWVFLLPRILGVGATLCESWAEARSLFATALDIAEREGARPELARTHLDLARMLAASGDEQSAVEHLEKAHGLFAQLGMKPFLERACLAAASLGRPLPNAEDADGRSFSPSEIDLLNRMSAGRTSVELARELLLSPETVEDRLAALSAKTGVADTVALAAYAMEHGRATERRRKTSHSAGAKAIEGKPASQTRVICFTDLARSTELLEKVGDVAARALLRMHEKIIRECLRAHGGEEIQHTGDGFMLSFASAGAALECSIAIQSGIAAHNGANPDRTLGVRIGMNAGEPIVEPGRLFGAAVHLAARICAHAEPRQILVSEVVRELARGKRFEFRGCATTHLKGFPEEFRLYSVLWEKET